MKNNFLRSIKSIFHLKQEAYLNFKEVLGFMPDTLSYYQLAVRHRSLNVDRSKKDCDLNNERLEFLGDALLSLIVADILFKHYPNQNEGFLTNARSNIVKRESLNRISQQLGINKLINSSKGVKKNVNRNILGNTLEALVAAVYLDFGYKRCFHFVEHRVLKCVDIDKILETEVNHKSKLIELCQHYRVPIQFELISDEVIKDNQHIFLVELIIGEKVVCRAEGKSKKNAEQNVACQALKIIDNIPNYFDEMVEKEEKELL